MNLAAPAFDIFGQALSGDSCVIQDALHAIRTHLDMEVAYFSEFIDGRTVFRRVDAPGLEHLIKPGDSQALDDVYCMHILEGRLPELIPDTSLLPLAMSMPITHSTPIGSHASVPVLRPDGSAFGMFCCLSPRPNPSLNDRDLDMLRVFAGIAAKQVNTELEQHRSGREVRARIESIIAEEAFSIAYQPIYDLSTNVVVSCEALSRFAATPYRTPDVWFAEAEAVGLGIELELAAIRAALTAFMHLPDEISLSVNASPDAILSGRLSDLLDARFMHRTILEVTEHARVGNYADLHAVLAPFKAAGLRVAIDDAGAGYSGLQHIIQLAPELIKLDMSLTRNIDQEPALRALVTAMTFYAGETGATVVAEGIETDGEMETLRRLGVQRGQGYLLGKPGPLATAAWLPAHVTDSCTDSCHVRH
ncbi:sensor domain-containing phosphodiesterase [Gemmatimonas groenlandica]|uniref:EAL domain-containing protein n=1 Tax=Gemmatimonas groenlandica TaxID=2732249 RepID=A0A6M4ITZ2_9BACT|nr:EAL domain-containing protein [Gemmatimonas groenlandica]QJR37665.1 EAL domain-containing protein [Gemmatimonas groenlandica]